MESKNKWPKNFMGFTGLKMHPEKKWCYFVTTYIWFLGLLVEFTKISLNSCEVGLTVDPARTYHGNPLEPFIFRRL